jgi:hypothetical protein
MILKAKASGWLGKQRSNAVRCRHKNAPGPYALVQMSAFVYQTSAAPKSGAKEAIYEEEAGDETTHPIPKTKRRGKPSKRPLILPNCHPDCGTACVRRHGRPVRRIPRFIWISTKNSTVDQDGLAKWTANAPLAFLDRRVGNLRRDKAIAIDVGDQDGLQVATGKLHEALDNYGIANSFEIYQSTHTSAVAGRFQNHVMPFFSKNCARVRTATERGVYCASARILAAAAQL